MIRSPQAAAASSVVAALALLVAAGAWADTRSTAAAADTVLNFDEDFADWTVETEGGATAQASRQTVNNGDVCLRLDAQFPGVVGVHMKPWRNWDHYNRISFEVQLGKGAHVETEPLVYFKDSEYWWYQALPFRDPKTGKVKTRVRPTKWQPIELDIGHYSKQWSPAGHSKPWYDATYKPKEFGLRFVSKKAFQAPILVRPIRFRTVREEPHARPGTLKATANGETIPQYGKFELTCPVDTYYANPYDPKVVDVQGHFTAPDGTTYDIPGFFYQAFERHQDDKGHERLVPTGMPQWKVRFSPQGQGKYSYYMTIRDGAERRSQAGSFTAGPPTDPRGLVRVSKNDGLYFEFDNGEWFYPIGQNVRDGNVWLAEGGQPGTYEIDYYFPKMVQTGMNFVRTWMCAWWTAIEWSGKYDGSRYHGLGRYSQPNAWRLDYTMQRAEDLGLFVELTLNNHGQLRRDKYDFEWEYSPWWTLNGGHLSSPGAYWTDPVAQDLVRQRYRYIVARWAYSQKLAAWDLWNEVDLVEGYTFKATDPVVQHLKQMAQYIRSIDPYDHIISTHYCLYWAGGPEIFEQPEMEFVQADAYWSKTVNQDINKGYVTRSRIKKPYLVIEFGRKPQAAEVQRELRCALWTTVAMPMAGAALPWQWGLIDKYDQYRHFAAVRSFMAGEDDRGKSWQRSFAVVPGTEYKCQVMRTADGSQARIYVFDYAKMAVTPPEQVPATPGVQVVMRGLVDGLYNVEYWDTLSGQVAARQQVPYDPQGRRLTLALPPIRSDLMIKIKPAA